MLLSVAQNMKTPWERSALVMVSLPKEWWSMRHQVTPFIKRQHHVAQWSTCTTRIHPAPLTDSLTAWWTARPEKKNWWRKSEIIWEIDGADMSTSWNWYHQVDARMTGFNYELLWWEKIRTWWAQDLKPNPTLSHPKKWNLVRWSTSPHHWTFSTRSPAGHSASIDQGVNIA